MHDLCAYSSLSMPLIYSVCTYPQPSHSIDHEARLRCWPRVFTFGWDQLKRENILGTLVHICCHDPNASTLNMHMPHDLGAPGKTTTILACLSELRAQVCMSLSCEHRFACPYPGLTHLPRAQVCMSLSWGRVRVSLHICVEISGSSSGWG